MVNETEIKRYEAYEKVRVSGVTNMFDLNNVCRLSGLTKDEVLDVMTNYDKYKKMEVTK